MQRITILGVGRVGGAIAWDLARDGDARVRVADRSEAALRQVAESAAVETVQIDLADSGALASLVGGEDLVVGALPSALGFAALRAVTDAGHDYVDISFFEEDPVDLDSRAKENGCTVVVDCGLAPGLSNLILGHEAARMDQVDSFLCQVGGLPIARQPPWEYRAPFAPIDVIAEYTRPARRMEAGELVTAEALSGLREVWIAGIGPLEAFDTDGLRTLLTTMRIPDMREQTVRYPGHAAKILLLRDSGFFSPESVRVGGIEVAPLALSARLLERQWRLSPEEADMALLRLEVVGRSEGEQRRIVCELLDRYDPLTGLSAMARTTGFTCTAIARRVLSGEFRRPGVWAPEQLGQEEVCYRAVVEELAERGIELHREVIVGA